MLGVLNQLVFVLLKKPSLQRDNLPSKNKMHFDALLWLQHNLFIKYYFITATACNMCCCRAGKVNIVFCFWSNKFGEFAQDELWKRDWRGSLKIKCKNHIHGMCKLSTKNKRKIIFEIVLIYCVQFGNNLAADLLVNFKLYLLEKLANICRKVWKTTSPRPPKKYSAFRLNSMQESRKKK